MKYKWHTSPYKFQVAAFKCMIHNGYGALFMEMGTGKSKVAVDFACAMYLLHGVTRVLILCPKSALPIWRWEIKKHAPPLIMEQMEWRLYNYDKLPDRYIETTDTWYEGITHDLVDWDPHVVILDESQKIKNPSAKRTKAVMRLAGARHKLLLSGTPVTNSPLDLFSQFKFLDDGILGTRFSHFKSRYAVWGGYYKKKPVRFINLDDLEKRVSPYVYEITKDEALDLPSKTHQVVPVKLERKARKIYNEMRDEAVVEFEGDKVTEPFVAVRLMRLAQMTGGFLKVDEHYVRVSKAKAAHCYQLLLEMRELNRLKIVIFCRFINDLRTSAQVAKKAGYKILLFHGGVSDINRERKLLKFAESDEPTAFVSQLQAGSLAISLTAAREAIYYSHSHSYENFAHSQDRIHRIGQHHPCTYYHLLCPGTVDMLIWLSLKTKRSVAELILRNPRLLMEMDMA